MGRYRSAEYSHLPKGMYFNKKGNTYYLRIPEGKDIRLGKSFHAALKAYWEVPNMYYTATSMREVIGRYMQEISPTKAASTHNTNIAAAKFLSLSFGDFNPKDIKPVHVYQHLEARKSSPIRANREISLLGAIFTEAIRWGVVEESPVVNIKRHKESPRTRLVTDNEILAFKSFAPEWMCLYIDLKLITALRQTDMLSLHSSMCDDDGLWVDTSKTGYKICFSLNNELQRLLKRLQELNGGKSRNNVRPLQWWLFSTKTGTPYSPDGFRSIWHRVMKKALESGQLKERFQERDLRARAATNCDTLMAAYELCGHSSISTTKRIYRRGYTHVQPVNPSKLLKKK